MFCLQTDMQVSMQLMTTLGLITSTLISGQYQSHEPTRLETDGDLTILLAVSVDY